METSSRQELEIQEFDFNQLRHKFGFYFLLGKRGTGKTTWSRYIASHIESCVEGQVIVITGNEKLKRQWSQTVAPLFVYEASEVDVLYEIQQNQNNVIYSYQNHHIPLSRSNSVTIILDDVACFPKVMKHPSLRAMASMGRHLYITVFLLAQYFYQVPTHIRSQFDFIFMLNTGNERSIKSVHREFASMVDLNVFKSILAEVTKDFGLLVIDVNSSGTHILDVCKYATLDDPTRQFRLGNELQWDFSKKMFMERIAGNVDMAVDEKTDREETSVPSVRSVKQQIRKVKKKGSNLKILRAPKDTKADPSIPGIDEETLQNIEKDHS